MKNIVIVGAGDLGKELVWLIEDINKQHPTYLILGYLDDDLSKNTYSFNGYRVLGSTREIESLYKITPFSAVLAIGDGKTRKKIVEEHPKFDSWETIIHPTAVVAPTTKIGKGSVLFPQVTVSVDSYIGSFGLLHIHSVICNDCWIANYSSVLANSTIVDHGIVKLEGTIIEGTYFDLKKSREEE